MVKTMHIGDMLSKTALTYQPCHSVQALEFEVNCLHLNEHQRRLLGVPCVSSEHHLCSSVHGSRPDMIWRTFASNDLKKNFLIDKRLYVNSQSTRSRIVQSAVQSRQNFSHSCLNGLYFSVDNNVVIHTLMVSVEKALVIHTLIVSFQCRQGFSHTYFNGRLFVQTRLQSYIL